MGEWECSEEPERDWGKTEEEAWKLGFEGTGDVKSGMGILMQKEQVSFTFFHPPISSSGFCSCFQWAKE